MSDGTFFHRDRGKQPAEHTRQYKTNGGHSAQNALISFDTTCSKQTEPVLGNEISGLLNNDLTYRFTALGEMVIGQRNFAHHRDVEQNGKGVRTVLVDVCQANARGRSIAMQMWPNLPQSIRISAEAVV